MNWNIEKNKEPILKVKENEKLPGGKEYGGVLTPASGLGQPLIDRLSLSGVNFDKWKKILS